MLETEIAWAAGFFDGEGCITHGRRHADGSVPLRLALNQVDRRPLDRFAQILGGSVKGPYTLKGKNVTKNASPYYALEYHNAEEVLILLWPYLSDPKREQAERVRRLTVAR